MERRRRFLFGRLHRPLAKTVQAFPHKPLRLAGQIKLDLRAADTLKDGKLFRFGPSFRIFIVDISLHDNDFIDDKTLRLAGIVRDRN
jgi:hypothetical protein